jgi:cation transport protein ChaC
MTTQAASEGAHDLWVFGYGSLMWRPGFPYREKQVATLRGCHRRLCVLSINHRGTPERPGLVLGLDHGGACTGLAFRVPAEEVAATRAYLREREQITMVYHEVFRGVSLRDGRRIRALAYVVNRNHRQYAGRLSVEEMLPLVRGAVGRSGANPDYVVNTVAELEAIGLADPALLRLAHALKDCGAARDWRACQQQALHSHAQAEALAAEARPSATSAAVSASTIS